MKVEYGPIRTIVTSNKLFILHFVELCVIPVAGKQIFMPADFFDLAVVKDNDFISFLNGGQAVGNNDSRASPHHL